MPKRMTATEKWEDVWFRRLPPKMKLFWIFLLDKCNTAGIWDPDFDLVRFYTGSKMNRIEVLRALDGRIQELPNGKWFVPKFIAFQYGELKGDNRATQGATKLLLSYGLIDENLKVKPLTSPYLGAKDKEKEQYKEKDMEKEKEKEGKTSDIIIPLEIEKSWREFKQHRSEKKKALTPLAEQKALELLKVLSGEDSSLAIKIIDQSIANGWLGLFELKEKHENNSTGNRNNGRQSEQMARATFKHGAEELKRLAELEATLTARDRERGKRS